MKRVFQLVPFCWLLFVATVLTPAALAQNAYVVNSGSNDVSVIDVTSNEVVGSIPVGATPGAIAITPDGRFAYVVNVNSNNVSVISTASNRVVGAPIPVGTNPVAIAITPDGRFAYVVNYNSSDVSVIETAGNRVVGRIPVGNQSPSLIGPPEKGLLDSPNPLRIAIAPSGRTAYVTNTYSHESSSATNDANDVSVIDTATNRVVSSISVGITAKEVAVSPASGTVFVSAFPDGYGTGALWTIDPASNQVSGSVSIGGEANGIAMAPDGRTAYVSRPWTKNVLVLDTRTAQKAGGIAVRGFPSGFAVNPDGRFAYVGNFPESFVSLIDLRAGKLTGPPIDVGRGPVAIAFAPATSGETSVRIGCPKSAGAGGCLVRVQAVTKKKGGKAQSAVAMVKLKAGGSRLVALKPKPRFAAKLAGAKRVLVREKLKAKGSTRVVFRRLKAVH